MNIARDENNALYTC